MGGWGGGSPGSAAGQMPMPNSMEPRPGKSFSCTEWGGGGGAPGNAAGQMPMPNSMEPRPGKSFSCTEWGWGGGHQAVLQVRCLCLTVWNHDQVRASPALSGGRGGGGPPGSAAGQMPMPNSMEPRPGKSFSCKVQG